MRNKHEIVSRGPGIERRILQSLVAIAAGLFVAVAPAGAQGLTGEARFDIAAQDLPTAIIQFSDQSGVQIVTADAKLSGLNTKGVNGMLPVEEALRTLLSGTGLNYKRVGDATVALIPGTQDSAAARKTSIWENARLAQSRNDQVAGAGESARSGADERSTAGAATENAARSALDEIIVTATKRAQSLQDVPISIAVIGNEDIERRGLIGMEDYLRSIPGVNQIDNGAQSNAIVIRGITTSPEYENAGTGSGSTVATYFDETPITAAAGVGAGGIDVRPVDIDRIEVLRGPQGTTFGSASLGGAMRIIPMRPKLDAFGAKVAASYSGTSGTGGDNTMMQGIVNIPVVKDKFALRAVGYRYDESGFYENVSGVDPVTLAAAATFGVADFMRGYTRDDVGRMESTGGRLAALWQPSERLNLYMNLLSQKIEQDGNPVATAGGFRQNNILPVNPQIRGDGDIGPFAETRMDLANAVLNYDLGWSTLTSVASWIDSGSDVTNGAFTSFPISTDVPSDFRSFSAEARLVSHFDGRFQFLGGLFYENVDEAFHQTVYWPQAGTNPFGTDPLVAVSDRARGLDQRAVFGELSYALTDKLSVSVGGRYFKYEKEEQVLQEGGLLRIPLGTGVRQFLANGESGSSYKANVNFKPTRESLLYASWAEGFRLGRPAAGLSAAVCDLNNDGVLDGTGVSLESTRTINSDFLENYEVGGKVALFDRRMVVDTSVYHIKWDGLPIRSITLPCPQAYVSNVGGATSDGVEFQASVFVVDGLRVDFGAGYVNAELSKDAPALPGSPKDGARLPGSPKVSANLAAQYDFNVAGHRAFVRADSFYVGKFYGDLLQTPGTAAGDYVKVDARAGVAIRNLTVELFVRNLTDEDAFTWHGLSASPVNAYLLRPRTIGIQLGYNFE